MSWEPRDTIADSLTYDGEAPPGPPVNLVVVHRDGLSTVPLYEGHALVVGRDAPAHVRPRSRRLSRQHARFELVEGVVYVEDMGSTNGTWIGHRAVREREVLPPGVEVLVGSVSITVGTQAPVAKTPPTVPRRPGHRGTAVVASPSMVRLFDTVDRVASSQLSVLICGETGAGKEVVARTIHDRSPRSGGPMRCINCGALPANLVESILFGHERGAFTGAEQRKIGVFEEASGGTVLLDEIGELSAPAQAALLRVLETRRVQRVGSTDEVAVDVRVLAATHRDLAAMCDAGTFRLDLLYRLNSVTLDVPPLRERLEELEPLMRTFIDAANLTNDRDVQGVMPEALERLLAYGWPGNLRELRNVVERAVVVASEPWITIDDLPVHIAGERPPEEPTPAFGYRLDSLQRSLLALDLKARVLAFEASLIVGALRATAGNQTRAAERLQMPRRTLVYRLSTLDPDDVEPVDVREGCPSFKDQVEAFEHGLIEEAMARTGGDIAAAARMLSIQKRTLATRLARWSDED